MKIVASNQKKNVFIRNKTQIKCQVPGTDLLFSDRKVMLSDVSHCKAWISSLSNNSCETKAWGASAMINEH